MTFINNISHENGNKTTASIQYFNLFPFYTNIKTSILLHLPLVSSSSLFLFASKRIIDNN